MRDPLCQAGWDPTRQISGQPCEILVRCSVRSSMPFVCGEDLDIIDMALGK